MIKIKIKKQLSEIKVDYGVSKYRWGHHVDVYKSFGVAIRKSMQALEARGIPISGAKRIESGGMGAAYLLKDSTILKVTSDEAEAKASAHMIGKNAKHIVTIKDVFKFPHDKHGQLYGIVQERLYPLDKQISSKIEASLKHIFTVLDGDWYVLSRSWEEIKSILDDSIIKIYNKEKDGQLRLQTQQAVSFL